MLKIPPLSRKLIYKHVLNQALQKLAMKGECYWKLDKPIWISVYQYPMDSSDGGIAWRILHNIIVTPRWLYQWKKRKKEDCPWCVSVSGTLKHMILECPHSTCLWNQLSRTLEYLLGTQNQQHNGYLWV
jgi:hypothetical protein